MRASCNALFFIIAAFCFAQSAFSWQTKQTESFIIHFTETDLKSAEFTSSIAEKSLDYVCKALEYKPLVRIEVWIAPSRDIYRQLQPRHLIPEWSIGAADPKSSSIYLLSPQYARKEGKKYDVVLVFRHELAHLILNKAVPDQHIPRFLDEGFARYISGEWTLSKGGRITIALFTNKLLPLAGLIYGFPQDAKEAQLAYLESESFIIYLAARADLPKLIRYLRSGDTPAKALMNATGMPLNFLQEDWMHFLQKKHSWILLFSDNLLWGFMTLLFILAYSVYYFRMKYKHEHLDDDIDDDPNPRGFAD